MKQNDDWWTIEVLLRIALGSLFIYAGAAKLRDLEDFFWDVHHFDLTPWDVSMVIAMYLPWLEITAGVALVARRMKQGALLIVLALSAVFLGAIGSAWWRGLDITCGCFGKEENATNFAKHFALNGGMVATSLLILWIQSRASTIARQSDAVATSE